MQLHTGNILSITEHVTSSSQQRQTHSRKAVQVTTLRKQRAHQQRMQGRGGGHPNAVAHILHAPGTATPARGPDTPSGHASIEHILLLCRHSGRGEGRLVWGTAPGSHGLCQDLQGTLVQALV